MHRFLTIFLAFSMLLSSVRVSAFVQKPPEDCLVCGHACCCPEVCAPLIKKMKEKKAAKHCGADGPGAMSCGQPDSICRIQSAPPVGFSNSKSETDWPNPQFTVLGEIDTSVQCAKGSLFNRYPLSPFSLSLDVPTPPPRLLPLS